MVHRQLAPQAKPTFKLLARLCQPAIAHINHHMMHDHEQQALIVHSNQFY